MTNRFQSPDILQFFLSVSSVCFIVYTREEIRRKNKKREPRRKKKGKRGEGITSTSRQHFTEINRFSCWRNCNCVGWREKRRGEGGRRRKKFVNYADSRREGRKYACLLCPPRILYYSAHANERRGLTRYGQTRRNDRIRVVAGAVATERLHVAQRGDTGGIRGGGEAYPPPSEQIIRNYCGARTNHFQTVGPAGSSSAISIYFSGLQTLAHRGLINFALSHHPLPL